MSGGIRLLRNAVPLSSSNTLLNENPASRLTVIWKAVPDRVDAVMCDGQKLPIAGAEAHHRNLPRPENDDSPASNLHLFALEEAKAQTVFWLLHGQVDCACGSGGT